MIAYRGLDISEYTEIEETVLQAVRERRAFSLIRLGHCEPRILGFPSFYPREQVNRTFRRQFGRKDFSDEEVIAMRELLREAVRKADVVGIGLKKSAEKESDELWINTPNILFHDELVVSQRFCYVNIHFQLLRSGFMNSLLTSQDDVCLITCRDVRAEFVESFGLRNVEWISVPEHAATAKNGTPDGAHWPDAFQSVMTRIDTLGPKLYLVGAGFLGKSYCNKAKSVGGTAIDMGSIFDVWSGIRSRSGHDHELMDRSLVRR